MAYIAIVGHGRELGLDREDAAVATLHDQIHLVVAVARPEVADPCARRLGVDPHRERHERLEQRTKQRTLTQRWRPHRFGGQQGTGVHSEQAGGEGGVREMVLRGHREP